MSDVVQGLKGDPAGESSVASKRHDVILIPCLSRATAAGGADGVETIAAPSQELVDIGLMAHVKDKMILRRVEDVVHREGHFDDTKIGAKMTARLGENGDKFFTDFPCQLLQLDDA